MNNENINRSVSDILVVDDVSENLKLLLNMLAPARYKVRPASNGAEALDAVKRKKPDLILLDIKMPGMDGFEVCKRLKADSQLKNIPIIFISGLSETDDKVKAFQAGGVDYITKPFQEEEVLIRVQTHIELQRMRMDLENTVAERTLELRTSEEQFRMTFEQAAVGLAHISLDGNFLRINQRFCDIVGYSTEEMLARTFQDITHPDDLDVDLELLRQVLADEIKTYSMEKRYFKKGGEVVWINLTVSLVLEDSGEPNYFISVIEDITKRKKAELALIESESKLREAHKIGKIGIWEWDVVAHKGYYSEEVFKIFDIDPDPDTKIVSDKMIEIIHPEDRERHDFITMNLFNKKVNNEPYDYRIIHRDGTIRYVYTDVHIKLDTDGNPLTIGGIVQDITERKLAEQDKEKLLHDVGERLKELTCLYKISDSIKTGKTLEQVFQDTLDAIPSGWHYPEITRGKLIFNNKEFVAEPFEETAWKQSSDIIVDGQKEGEVEVYYLEEKPLLDEGPFLKEERNLINSVAYTLSQAIEHMQANQALKKEAKFQKIVAKISTLFINLPANNIDEVINEQFKEIGEFFNADRVSINQLNKKGEILAATNMWFSDKINAEKLATDMKGATYPNLINHLKDKEYWSFSDPDDFSPWHPERETVGKTDFKSGLIIVTSFEESIIELFVIDFTQSNKVWTKNIIEQVKLLGNAFSNALNRKRAEQALLKEAEFKQLVSEISSRFIGLSGVEFEDAIQNSLSEISIYFKADAVRLFSLSLQGALLKHRFIWRSEHIEPAGELAKINSMIYPNFATHFSSGKSFVFNKFSDIPQWPEMHEILKFSGIRAGIGVPLESDKSGVDIFTIGNVISGHQWPKGIIEQSKTIGQALLNAILRSEAEIEIQKGYSEIKQLKDNLLQENIYLKEEIKGIKNFDTIIGQSKALKYVLFRVEQVAPTDTTVLISGETGTGKEVFTNALFQSSLRKNKPLVKVNCAALSPTLIESELFGHEKGAFTGANEKRIGRFELADGGTIFLDEIGELSLEVQAKLLRVLQEGEFERLGSSKTIKVNVRIIAATNRNLEEEVKNNRFRVDLYYRLTTFIITIPPLRDRKEDIPLLVKFLVNKLGKKLNKSIKKVPHTVMRKLISYSWPGNVRELENVIENALIITNGEVLRAELPGNLGLANKGESKLEDLEREHIIKVLDSVNWQIGGKDGAAEKLGLKRTTLNSKMKKHKIEKH